MHKLLNTEGDTGMNHCKYCGRPCVMSMCKWCYEEFHERIDEFVDKVLEEDASNLPEDAL